MIFKIDSVLIPFLITCFITLFVTPLSLLIIRRVKLYDDPSSHKHPAILHSTPIPRGGGIPFFLGIFIASIFFLPLSSLFVSIFSASFLALIIGIVDDKYDISPYVRFLGNIAIALIIVGSGITISFITNPLGGILPLETITVPFPFFAKGYISLVSDLITVIWIVWVMNMLNWSKGVDGQMPGIVGISALIIGILSLRFSQQDNLSLFSATLSFIIAGSALGFLPYNFHPAKIFPGYGTTSVYLLLAVVSILSGAKLATAILVMGIPMIDGIFTVVRRLFEGKSPFWHDKKHLHHLLLQLGFSQRKIALFYWIFSAILGMISLMLSSTGKLFALIMLGVIVGGGLLFLHIALRNIDEKRPSL